MARLYRWTGRLALFALMSLTFAAGDRPAVPACPDASASLAVAPPSTEVRLRRLYRARPDLLEYPMVVEVVC